MCNMSVRQYRAWKTTPWTFLNRTPIHHFHLDNQPMLGLKSAPSFSPNCLYFTISMGPVTFCFASNSCEPCPQSCPDPHRHFCQFFFVFWTDREQWQQPHEFPILWKQMPSRVVNEMPASSISLCLGSPLSCRPMTMSFFAPVCLPSLQSAMITRSDCRLWCLQFQLLWCVPNLLVVTSPLTVFR